MEVITFRCTSCKHVLKITAEKAGRKAKCNRCGTIVTIPAASDPPPQEDPPKPSPPSDDDEGGTYGLFKDEGPSEGASALDAISWKAAKTKKADSIESDLEEREKKKPPIAIPKGQEPEKLRIRNTRSLLEPERWKKVKVGLGILGAGMAVGILPLLLQKAMWMLANPNPEYAGILLAKDNGKLEGITFYTALFTGEAMAGTSVVLAIVAQVFFLLQSLVLLGGYVFCLAVPSKFGTSGQAFTLVGLGGINLILRIVFWLLPLLGFLDGCLPLLVPEVALISAGTDRIAPIMALWMDYPFWGTLLAVVLLIIQLAEPMMLGIFIRSIGLSMKSEPVENSGLRLAKLAMSQGFMQLFFFMLLFCGTSNVLQWVLLILYWLAWSFWLGTVIYFVMVLLWVPKRIQKELGDEEE